MPETANYNEYGYPEFTEQEFQRRHRRVRDLLAEHDVDALLVYGDSGLHQQHHAQVQYLSGYLGHGRTYLVFFRDPNESSTLFWGVSNHGQIANETCIFEDVRWGENRSPEVAAERVTNAETPVNRVGIVGISSRQNVLVPHHHYNTLEDALECELVDLMAEFETLRYQKSDAELEWFRRGAELTDQGLRALVSEGEPGMTGHELKNLVESAYLRDGGEKFVTFLSSASMTDPDPGVALPWRDASARTVRVGDVVTTELSASFRGYPGQVHRPIAVGTSPTAEYRDMFEVARETYERLFDAVRAGNTADDVADAMAPIEESDYHIYDVNLHGFGQLLQPPFVGTRSEHSKYWPANDSSTASDWVFEEGQLITIQPNVVSEDERFGLQLGTTVVVRDGAPENLHDVPVEFLRMSD